MYFLRVQISHLWEAMQIIPQIQKSSSLRSLIGRCDHQTRSSFAELEKFVTKGSSEEKELGMYVGPLRNRLTFHYYGCDKPILDAITNRGQRTSSITRASTAHRWRFSVADDVVDTAVVQGIWHIDKSADIQAEADKVADRVHKILLTFVDFAGEFIWKYCEE